MTQGAELASKLALGTAGRNGTESPLARVEARLERIESMLGRLEHLANLAPGLLGMTGDIVDEFARHAEAEGADLQRATANLGTTLKALVRTLGDPETKDLLESSALSGPALHTINAAARSLVAARDAEPLRAGFFAAMNRMRDPEVQRAIGFMLTAAKAFGARLDEAAETPADGDTARGD